MRVNPETLWRGWNFGRKVSVTQGSEDAAEVRQLLIRMDGRNDEALLLERFDAVERIAEDAGGELIGVQFFGEDDVRSRAMRMTRSEE